MSEQEQPKFFSVAEPKIGTDGHNVIYGLHVQRGMGYKLEEE